MANKRRSKAELQEIDAVVERLREFIRLEYLSHEKIAALIGVHDSSLHAWLSGKTRPVQPERITAFLENRGAEKGSGLAPAGYEYREYKNWRGVPKLRRCPFCKRAKAEIRKTRGAFQGVCPNCGAAGPKREGYDDALMAWNARKLNSSSAGGR